jgi:hypothetical protein
MVAICFIYTCLIHTPISSIRMEAETLKAFINEAGDVVFEEKVNIIDV